MIGKIFGCLGILFVAFVAWRYMLLQIEEGRKEGEQIGKDLVQLLRYREFWHRDKY